MLVVVEDGWERVAKAVRSRREALGLTQEQAAARSGGLVSSANWRVIEAAGRTSYRNATKLGVCSVLGWTNESIDLILEGADPITLADVSRVAAIDLVERELEIARRKLHEIEEVLPTVDAIDRQPFQDKLEEWEDREKAALWMLEELQKSTPHVEQPPSERQVRLAQQILDIPARLAAKAEGLPASLTGKLSQLTPDQLLALDAYIDGLIDGGKR